MSENWKEDADLGLASELDALKSHTMKMSSDDQKAIGLILVCVGFLFFLIGLAARFKENFHSRAEISTTGFTVAAILAGLGVIVFLFSLGKRRG
jgi:hypothetical protein